MKIRKKSLFSHFFLSAVLLAYTLFRISTSDEQHKVAMDIVVAVISLFGLLVKIVLNLIFPQIQFDSKGIKFFGAKRIHWKEIKNIEVSTVNDDTRITIIKANNKKLTEQYKDLNIDSETLQTELNENLTRYGFHNIITKAQ